MTDDTMNIYSLTLATPLSVNDPAQDAPPSMAAGGEGEVWIFVEQRCEAGLPNPDMQLLLYNMDAHKVAMKLLQLPLPPPRSSAPTTDQAWSTEHGTRQTLLAAYRLLRALCSSFKITQLAMMPEVPRILEHVGKLVAYDITPTGCLESMLQDLSLIHI